MKVTVLGCYGNCPCVNGACSGYLIQNENVNILLDCGNGTISRAQRYCKIEDINVIILSHLHFDHMADIFLLKYAIETKMCKGQEIGMKKLFLPANPVGVAGELYDDKVFDIENIEEGIETVIGGLSFSFVKMSHLIESYAIVVKRGEKKFVYSGDTGYNEKLVETVKDADLFLCESSLLEEEGKCEINHHLSAEMAGRIASQGKVKKLLLTHFWYEDNKKGYLFEAKKHFDNSHLVEEFSTYDIFT